MAGRIVGSRNGTVRGDPEAGGNEAGEYGGPSTEASSCCQHAVKAGLRPKRCLQTASEVETTWPTRVVYRHRGHCDGVHQGLDDFLPRRLWNPLPRHARVEPGAGGRLKPGGLSLWMMIPPGRSRRRSCRWISLRTRSVASAVDGTELGRTEEAALVDGVERSARGGRRAHQGRPGRPGGARRLRCRDLRCRCRPAAPRAPARSRHIHGSNAAARSPVTGERLKFDPHAMSSTRWLRMAETAPKASIRRVTNSVMTACEVRLRRDLRREPSRRSSSPRAMPSSALSEGVRPRSRKRRNASGAVGQPAVTSARSKSTALAHVRPDVHRNLHGLQHDRLDQARGRGVADRRPTSGGARARVGSPRRCRGGAERRG